MLRTREDLNCAVTTRDICHLTSVKLLKSKTSIGNFLLLLLTFGSGETALENEAEFNVRGEGGDGRSGMQTCATERAEKLYPLHGAFDG